MSELFMAIDIGASSGRHVLGEMRGGRLAIEEIYRFPNSPRKANDRLTWDVKRLFAEILNGMKRAKEIGRVPATVAIDTWGCDYVLLDAKGNLVCDAFSYRDPRTEEAVRAMQTRVPFEELYRRTGIQFQPFNTVFRLYADARCGRLGAAEKMLMLPDYFYFLLTGRESREYTNATSTGLIDAKTRKWDCEVIDELGLPRRLFPETSEAGTLLGPLTKEIAREVGYRADVILSATHDTASAVIAAPFGESALYLSSGTWSLLGAELDRPIVTDSARMCNFTNEGHVVGGVRFQKNIMGLWIVQQLRREDGDSYSFAELSEGAREGEDAPLFDVNDGRFLAPENMHMEIRKAVGRKLSRNGLARCVFRSLAESYAQTIAELESIAGKRYRTLNVIGGGSMNGYLNELTAAASGKDLVAGPTEATAIGNLAVQMTAKGLFPDLKSAKAVIADSFAIG